LQKQFQKHWGANSLFVFNSTWLHNLTGNASDRSNAPQNTYDVAAGYGPSALVRRHNITARYVYNLPWFKEQHSFTGHVLGGWEVSELVYYYTGDTADGNDVKHRSRRTRLAWRERIKCPAGHDQQTE
jgi:hypothetical protein